MSSKDPIVIVAAKRTAMGSMLGCFADVAASQLGAITIKAALQQANVRGANIHEVIMGCVLPAGQGQAPARQAAMAADIPNHVGAVTINKMCGSGMKAVMLAADALCAYPDAIFVAGGFENMSQAPYLLPDARKGHRLGHKQTLDHMFYDGLEDAYDKGRLMGHFAEQTASHYQFTREQQDQFAITSLQRAQAAIQNGYFEREITPVTVTDRKGNIVVTQDETPGRVDIAKIPQLKPAFASDGTVTAANSSSISDGAAALVLMRRMQAVKLGLTPLATIVATAQHAQEPAWFTTAPAPAIKQVLEKAKWPINQVDLFEINEAFAVVTMAAMHDLRISHDIVNIHGGACALGHPIGASGARIITTLIYALQQQGLRRGVASLCIGGGEATAIAIECDTL